MTWPVSFVRLRARSVVLSGSLNLDYELLPGPCHGEVWSYILEAANNLEASAEVVLLGLEG